MKIISRLWLTGVATAAALTLTCSTSESQSPSQVTPLPIMELRASAWEAISAEDWERSAHEYAELTQLNPHFGAFWINLGISQMRLEKYDDAEASFEQARIHGYDPRECYYDQACALALAGDADKAVLHIQRSYAAGYINDHDVRDDPDLRSLHSNASFRSVVGWPDKAITNRTDQWNLDLDYLDRRFRELHWRPFEHVSESAYETHLGHIRGAIEESSDAEMRLYIQALMARVGDGHTVVVGDGHMAQHGNTNAKVRFLPIKLFWFDDGMRVAEATDKYKHLLGARVTHIGHLTTDSLMQRAQIYISSDNEWSYKDRMAHALTDHHILAPLELGNLSDGFVYHLEMTDGSTTEVSIPAGGREASGRTTIQEASGKPLPLRYKDKDSPLFMEMTGNALYVRMDGIQDTHGETFAEFTNRIFTTAEQKDARMLFIDLRDNYGGQGHLMQPLLHGLIKSDRFQESRTLWVMIGRKTFSAAMALAAQIDMHTKARFVGEPTGSRPNFVGESSIITLPYSGLAISVSSRYHQNGGSNDVRPWISPDVVAAPSFEAWRSGRDDALTLLLK